MSDQPPAGSDAPVEPRDRGPKRTRESLAAITVGELRPLTAPITFSEPDPAWPGLYAREQTRIRSALGERVIRIAHTGSTSVPGLAAKPILDITLLVADVLDEDAYARDLEAVGYVIRIREHEPDWFDHRVLKGPDTNVNLHVFSDGCVEWDRMVGFRDWLRTHDDDRALYERTKRDLLERRWEYVQDYADAKTEVVEEIIARAGLPPRRA